MTPKLALAVLTENVISSAPWSPGFAHRGQFPEMVRGAKTGGLTVSSGADEFSGMPPWELAGVPSDFLILSVVVGPLLRVGSSGISGELGLLASGELAVSCCRVCGTSRLVVATSSPLSSSCLGENLVSAGTSFALFREF